jgi:hypothetical protein
MVSQLCNRIFTGVRKDGCCNGYRDSETGVPRTNATFHQTQSARSSRLGWSRSRGRGVRRIADNALLIERIDDHDRWLDRHREQFSLRGQP